MKVALRYLPCFDENAGEYRDALGIEAEQGKEWLYPMDSTALLPVGSEIWISDDEFNVHFCFEVDKWEFFLDQNVLCLLVKLGDSPNSPSDFSRYIKTKWIDWDQLKH